MNSFLFSFRIEPPPPKKAKKSDVASKQTDSEVNNTKSLLRSPSGVTRIPETQSEVNNTKSLLRSPSGVAAIPETQDSPLSITSSINIKSPNVSFTVPPPPPNTIMESPSYSITSSIKSQKSLDDNEDDEPPVEPPKKIKKMDNAPKLKNPEATKELPMETPTPLLSSLKSNKRPSRAKSSQMTFAGKESMIITNILPEPVIDEDASNEAENHVEKEAELNESRVESTDPFSMVEPAILVEKPLLQTPNGRSDQGLSEPVIDKDASNEAKNHVEKQAEPKESIVERAISVEKLHTPNGHSNQTISGLVTFFNFFIFIFF